MKNIVIRLFMFFMYLLIVNFGISQTEERKQARVDNLLLIKKNTLDQNLYELNSSLFNELKSSVNNITIQFPLNDEIVDLNLTRVNSEFTNYKIQTSSGRTFERNYSNHYRGKVKGNDSSVVALSIYNNYIQGLISVTGLPVISFKNSENGLVVTNYEKESSIINCYTDPRYQNDLLEELYNNLGVRKHEKVEPQGYEIMAGGNHLEIYVEADFGMYQNLGSSVSNVENYIVGLFNQVGSLYFNEEIYIQISEIFVWDTFDSYNVNLVQGLDDFVSNRSSFDGDLALLLSYIVGNSDPDDVSNAGGIANGIGGLCETSNPNLSPHSHINIFPDFELFPTFSRQVKVVAHEIGHNLGSRHTHACVWNGNNTAIDGCGSCMETVDGTGCNGCLDPGNPILGGTIMSYCDREDVGIDFSLGFGQQPGTIIRNFVNSALCLDCDLTTVDYSINIDSRIEACDVIFNNVSIGNNSDVVVLPTGTVNIQGTFEAQLGSSLEIRN